MAIAVALATAAPPARLAAAEAGDFAAEPAPGDWPAFGRDPGGSRYSPLDQIDATNFARLEIAWRWSSISKQVTDANPRIRAGEFKVVPVVAGGLVYVATEVSQVAAIDPGTGETVWQYDPESWKDGRPANVGFQHRGVAYWSSGAAEGGDARVLIATHDRRLIALDARTGVPVAGFGDGGAVDLLPNEGLGHFGRKVNRRHITHSSPPTVVRDTVIVGSIVHDGPTHQTAPPGHVRAYDARTGALKWVFHTIPWEGEYGNETWEDGSWKYTGAANVWSMMTADPELGYVYLPTGTPTNDMYGGHRLGDNLFAESIVCLDAETGRRVWHFQAVHHGVWDYDLPTSPNLVDITVGGRRIKALAQVSKQAFTYVLDRVTGEPVWPIEERPVPQSKVPGERTSPTQPFPTKPAAFDLQGTSEDVLNDLTPALKAEALEIAKAYRLGPLYTPPTIDGEDLPTLMLPSPGGGANWPGAAFDPETGMLYVPSSTSPSTFPLTQPDPSRSDFTYTLKSWFTVVPGPQGLPLVRPPWGRVTAIDLSTGEHVWMTPNGEGPTDHPALEGVETGPLGAGSGAPLATKTLLFVTQARGRGERNSPRINVFDKASGKLLGHVPLPQTPHGNPITYLHQGRQYLVVAVGGGPFFAASPEDFGESADSAAARQLLAAQPTTTNPELIAFRLR
ncbi:MAG TPA: pyrroloquinoline quinone-dependent dehydrogenase [Thermoanaerobaculia bacterium]|nr:pyrroloquinoline quinone-dependent dehydrogenase [Thermoanaerobaculia bacterium]